MSKSLLIFCLPAIFSTCFAQEVLYSEKPFNGKGNVKDMLMVTHQPTQQIVSVIQSSAARKITILQPDKQVVAEYAYLLTGKTGFTGKAPTDHKYVTLNGSISGLLEFPPIDIWHSGLALEEVYANADNGYSFLSTRISDGAVTIEELQAPAKSVALGLIRDEDDYHILFGLKRSNELLIYTKKPGKPLIKKQLTVDFSSLVNAGLINEKERGQLPKMHPAYLLASFGESTPSKPRRMEGFHGFEELTQLTTLLVEDGAVQMYLSFDDGLLIKVGIDLETTQQTVVGRKIDFTDVQAKIRNFTPGMEGVDYAAITQKPAYTYFGCSKMFYQMLQINSDNCLLSLINRNTLAIEHAYYFDKQGRGFPVPADSAVKPMSYYAGISVSAKAGIDKFFKILNSTSPAAVQFFKLNESEWFLSIEVDDLRMKVSDVVFAAADVVPLFGLGGATIAEAFLRGFAYGGVVSSLEVASAATRKKTTFTIPLLISNQGFGIQGIAPPPLPADNMKAQLQSFQNSASLKELSQLSIGTLNDGRIAKIYDKKSDMIWIIRL